MQMVYLVWVERTENSGNLVYGVFATSDLANAEVSRLENLHEFWNTFSTVTTLIGG